MIKQKGIVIWIYLVIGLVLFGIGSAVVLTYKHAITAKEKAEADLRITKDSLATAQTAIETLHKDEEALQKQLVIRRAASVNITKSNANENIKIATIKSEDTKVFDWLITPVPINLLNRLRDSDTTKDSNTKTSSTKSMVGTGEDTGVERDTNSNK